MLVGLSGPTAFYDIGDPYDCDEAEAARLIGARYAVPWIETATIAVPAPPSPPIERAVAKPVETRGKGKRKK